jgi:hypothetical protein
MLRIPYRASAAAVLLSLALLIAIDFIPIKLPPPLAKPGAEYTSSWDPCSTWEQIPQTVRLAALLFFGALVVNLVLGLRNRSAPRWLAIAGLISLALLLNRQFRRFPNCSDELHSAAGWVWILLVMLMFLHHAIQRLPHPAPHVARNT